MYLDKDTGDYPLEPIDIIQRHQHNTSFPVPFEAPDQYVLVTESERPAFDPATHKVVELAPVEAEGGYLQKWKVVKLTKAELEQIEAERLAAEQVAKDAALVIVTKRQALLAIFDLKGIRDDQIDALIGAIPDEDTRYRAKVDWAGSAAIESDSPTVLMLAAALELSEADLAALFEYAQAL